MNKACESVQSQLAELEPGALQPDSDLAAHIDNCPVCQAVWAALAEVDDGFAAMPPLAAPEDLIARTLSVIADDGEAPESVAHGAASASAELEVAPPHTSNRWIRLLDALSRYPQAVAAAAALLFLTTILGLGGLWLTGSEEWPEAGLVVESSPDDSQLISSSNEEYNGVGWSKDESYPGHSGGGGDRWESAAPTLPASPRLAFETTSTEETVRGGVQLDGNSHYDAPTEVPAVDAPPPARQGGPSYRDTAARELRPAQEAEPVPQEEPEEGSRGFARRSNRQRQTDDGERQRDWDRRDPSSDDGIGLFAQADVETDRASSSDSRRRPDRSRNQREQANTHEPADRSLGYGLDEDASGRGEGLAALGAPRSGPAATGETALQQGTITFDDGRYGDDFGTAGEGDYYAYAPPEDRTLALVDEEGEEEEIPRRSRIILGAEEIEGRDSNGDGYFSLETERSESVFGGQDAQDVARLESRLDELVPRGPEYHRMPSAGDLGGNITTIPHGAYGVVVDFGPSASDRELARSFLSERERTADLTYRAARGYWANTYIPGAPVLRELQRRLEYTDEQSSGQTSGLALARGADTYSQPFDRPQRSALAVYLQADHRGVTGESRVLLQVGLQGTSRQSGRRPAMNIGVVLDLRHASSPQNMESIHALLGELSESRDVGDHFSLTVAGMPGGTVIPPGSFGYGPVTVVANDLLSGLHDRTAGLTLAEAMEAAVRLVRENDDPTAVLGSSLVLMVTPNTLGADARELESIAHVAAVDGIPTSVVGVGAAIDLAELDRVALAGQGNRRLLDNAADAEMTVDAELSAASRVVARAVRLRIRLAPGVRLVDILGSHRLDEADEERVREAEQSIDQRVARSLGITADRGEDEDGIQIVIPAFYADDRHVILLDVVASGPGPVADVTLRYKDLVFLRNGVAMDTLRLERNDTETGPLQVNVLKNLVAFELSETLKRAGELLHAGHVGTAVAEISNFSGLVRGLQGELPQFTTDPEIFADLEMIRTYVQILGGTRGGYMTAPTDLADSLLYAGYRKLLDAHEIDDR